MGAPCAAGIEVEGKRCPQAEHACTTFEGEAVWQSVIRSGAWTGGGMTARRVNRAEVRARQPGTEPWIIDDLLDTFEPAANAASAKADERKKTKTKPEAS